MLSLKKCSFRDCSTTSTSVNCTLFAFPKDPIRYKQWLAQCSVTASNNHKDQFMCEKHFDAQKYISNTPRRKILMSTAIPEYKENGERIVLVADNDGSCGGVQQPSSTLQIKFYHPPLHTERPSSSSPFNNITEESSTAIDRLFMDIPANIDIDIDEQSTVEQQHMEALEIDANSINDEPIYLDLVDSEDSDNFQIDTESTHDCDDNGAMALAAIQSAVVVENGDGNDILYYDADATEAPSAGVSIDKPAERLQLSTVYGKKRRKTTTFIGTDGVEYIKMPKQFYVQERERLHRQLNRYRSVLQRIKRQVNAVIL